MMISWAACVQRWYNNNSVATVMWCFLNEFFFFFLLVIRSSVSFYSSVFLRWLFFFFIYFYSYFFTFFSSFYHTASFEIVVGRIGNCEENHHHNNDDDNNHQHNFLMSKLISLSLSLKFISSHSLFLFYQPVGLYIKFIRCASSKCDWTGFTGCIGFEQQTTTTLIVP